MRNPLIAAGLALCALVVGAAAVRADGVTSLYYQELEKDGRVYVFNTPETFASFNSSGEMGKSVTLIGKAEGGKTLVAENETAVDLYLFKHDLPAYDRPTPEPVRPAKYPATKIQGRFYGDVTHREIKNDDGTYDSGSGFGVDVKRFYLTVTHQVDETWSAQFQSDIGDFGTKRYDVFVKKAYLQGKFSDAATVRVGAADTPWIPFAEKMYTRRYFEQTQSDSLGFGTSSDWGIHLFGKLGSGLVDYQVSAVNGRSYSDPTRSESVDFEGRLAIAPIEGLTFGVGGYTGKRGRETKENPAKHTAERLNALVNFQADRFQIGGEWYETRNWTTVTSDDTDKSDGYSIWGDFDITDSIAIFGRYDQGNPSKELAPDKELTYYTVGVEKEINKVFTAALAWKHAETDG
ncbi:MAG TPA: porin, partial [Thermoanaerobaculia bacterium]|nr:porin [Thermoanaerobaculia bacterium]